ncbi:MAG: hypothetical protein A2Z91_05605 [Deltaproteobacteria bacterium GWA2_38_16]|nr:MAG: hypothetical protein A2Z91_05605 [Deltaproteobacteria bacterium GWA2_38_16]OGQ03250.1 MAG: hypothetical protein A3D19_04330 [Deltaproteobacteria bacterium RIFCSPHIGHO2_02_FULL_38_15]OGQ34076.1 MAG: hypothetical protein A3A72_04510 [Deltaproteobacteria bacterium RIFCSPLOWO2_01_FULL_38_9]HBQ21848.1 hypothetical protein [Deltaproteobacteria bacterium]
MNTFLLLLISSIIILFKLGALGILETSEARYAEIAYEMAMSGDWLTPRIWHITDFQKPPFMYWTTALSYKVFGASEFAARLPAALSAILAILVCYHLGKTLFNKRVGFYAALLLLASPLYLGASKILNLDIFVLLFTALMFLMFLKDRFFLFYVFMGLSILVKGPMTLFYVIPTLLIFLAMNRELSKLKNMQLLRGAFIFLLISLPWFVWESIQFKDKELWKFFVYGQLGSRFLPFIKAFESYKSIIPLPTKPFYYYGLIFIPAFLPSILGIIAGRSFPQKREFLFLLSWILAPLILFSLMPVKQPLYIVTLAIPLALLSAYSLSNLIERIPTSKRMIRFAFLGFFTLVFIGHFFIHRYEHHTKSVKAFLPVLYAHPDTQIILYRIILRAIPFYTNKRPIFIHTQDPVGSRHFDLTFDDPKNYSPYFLLDYHNMDSLMELLKTATKTFIFSGYEWKEVLNAATEKKIPLFICHQTPKYTLMGNFNCLEK